MHTSSFIDETAVMQRALALARTGQGRVEPNPCVGAVLVDEKRQLLGEGCHERFGGPHAEVMALRQAGSSARGATLYVTLEPCNHHGQTPPCTEAVIAAGISKVVIAAVDPANHGAGSGIERLRSADVEVVVGMCAEDAEELIAPFALLSAQSRPYVHAKWALTLDGKLATRTGSSKWISNERSRERVHALRGRMDGIITGIGTVLADDPLLTARPPGPRTATRIVLDSQARLPLDSQLIRTSADTPVLVVTTPDADHERCQALSKAGIEVLVLESALNQKSCNIPALLQELGRRRFTNVLLEAGSKILGAFHDLNLIDEVHCFIAPKIAGGANALSPMGGIGREHMPATASLKNPHIELIDGDIYIRGQVQN